ncbi:butyrophilin subfamily 1 member A1-like isoform X2 [Pelodiscus sinensis]|uniref:butyrophilin subfamily 1 member A1-like isoform X2 n=1 Tax=Pelodiscus sinensis TaxID=13735 RepID=UPI003F6B34A1
MFRVFPQCQHKPAPSRADTCPMAMASTATAGDIQEEAICPICLEYLTEPVTIACGHNFCRACLTRHCEQQGANPPTCPQCRAPFQKGQFKPNTQLSNIVQKLQQLGPKPGAGRTEDRCERHEERLKLFCQEDGVAICLVCEKSRAHKSHTVVPVEEAAQEYKEKLQGALGPLRKQLEEAQALTSKEEEKTTEWQRKVQVKREMIGGEFNKLHMLLREEEQLLLQRLAEEERETLQRLQENVTKLSQQSASLQQLITEMEGKCQQPVVKLLKDVKSTLSRSENMELQEPEAICTDLQRGYKICLDLREALNRFADPVIMMFSSGYLVLCLALLAPRLASAQFTVTGPDHPIRASVGGEAILPCHLSPRTSAQAMEVRWYRSQFSPVVHLYHDGQDQYEKQMQEYQGRTELLRDNIANGSVSLRIRDIQLSDEGHYNCFFQSLNFYQEASMILQVTGLGSSPDISVEGHQDGGVRLVCRSSGWYPEPKAQWRDFQGQLLPGISEKIFPETSGLFQTEITIVITEESNQKVSCHVWNPLLNQERESTISIAGRLQAELRWRCAQLYAVDVTLDPETANPYLVLSEDRKHVVHRDKHQGLPNNSERFDTMAVVLGTEGFTSGRHYWEVEVGDKKVWTLGVCRETVTRKGHILFVPANGYWTIWQVDGQCTANTSSRTPLPMSARPSRLGIFLDYEAGEVSFYNVTDRSHLFTFTDTFSGTLRPYFNPEYNKGGTNMDPLIICPVPPEP